MELLFTYVYYLLCLQHTFRDYILHYLPLQLALYWEAVMMSVCWDLRITVMYCHLFGLSLGFEPWKITHASDNFGKLYDFAVELIKR